MKDKLYEELNNFTLWTGKVAQQIVLSPEEYVLLIEPIGPTFPFKFHDKDIFIQMASHPHTLLTIQEWIELGCPKNIDKEEGKIGWTSSPYFKRQEKEM